VFLAPRHHYHSFAKLRDEMIHSLAVALKDVLLRIKKCLRDPPYNFVIHTAPNTEAAPRRTAYWDSIEADFHWHIEIMPRLTASPDLNGEPVSTSIPRLRKSGQALT
jgi:UDPglucose--hexose-1-phosphate uridylyltransferase